jgi:hypothetical protein
MPLTDQDIRALVHLAVACRPTGAPRWDEGGIFANIAKVRTLAVDDVALATIRAAADAKAKTPGVISNTSAPNWQERAINRPVERDPYDRLVHCDTCGKTADRHGDLAGHPFETRHEADKRRDAAHPKPPIRTLIPTPEEGHYV